MRLLFLQSLSASSSSKIGVELDYEVDVTDLKAFYLASFMEPNIAYSWNHHLVSMWRRATDFGSSARALYGSMQGARNET